MRKREINILKFDEFPKEKQKKIIDKLRETFANNDYEFHSKDLLEEFKDSLEKEFGIMEPEIQYTGFWSQGDGASISCKNIDVKKFLSATGKSKLIPAIFIDDIHASLDRVSHHYSHENTVKASVENYGSEEIPDQILNTLETLLDEFQHKKAREIYKTLEKEYDYVTSDEYLKETIEANDWEFNEETLQIE
jgi:hypothetical protein